MKTAIFNRPYCPNSVWLLILDTCGGFRTVTAEKATENIDHIMELFAAVTILYDSVKIINMHLHQ